jgi:hypothetical protein
MRRPGASGTVATGGNVVPETMTAQEFRRGIKRDIAHYTNCKDDEHFSTWNWKLAVTTQLVLNLKYVAKTAFE